MPAVLVNPGGSQHALVDLTAELTNIAARDHGESGKLTHTLVSLPGLRVVLVSMKAAAKWSEHATPGRITVQPLVGQLLLRWHGEQETLIPGRLLALASNVPHDVLAETDAAFLLTVARPQADETAAVC